MVKDAEKFAEEDKKKREAVDVKNQVGRLPPTRLFYVLNIQFNGIVARCPLSSSSYVAELAALKKTPQ